MDNLIEDFPENVRLVFGDQSVIFIFAYGSFERLTLGHHEEKDNGGSEHICSFTGVSFQNMLFWRHVAECAFVFVKNIGFVLTLEIGGKTEICNFKVEVFVH